LPPVTKENDIIDSQEPPVDQELINQTTLAAIEKVETALPQVKGLETSDQEMDELADLAKEAFNNLMDLGMQTDPRFSAEIFSVGGAMLGHALTAKTAKIQKKLKMIDLQLKQAELERKLAIAAKESPSEETPLGVGQIVDRNQLIRLIMDNANNKNINKDK
jgi:hypothetical protein